MNPLRPAFRTSCRFIPKPSATTELCKSVRAMPRLSLMYGCGKLRPKTIPTVSAIGGETNPVNESASARAKIIFGTVGIDREESIRLEAEWASKNELYRRKDVRQPSPNFQRASFLFFFWRRHRVGGLCRSGFCARRMRQGGDDFGRGGFADLAVAVVNAALREREGASTIAGFRVEFVERGNFLFRRQFREVDAGKFGGAFGILQENLAGILERFHFDVADGQSEERANLRFVKDGIAKPFVFLNDAAFGVQDKRSGKRGDAAIL